MSGIIGLIIGSIINSDYSSSPQRDTQQKKKSVLRDPLVWATLAIAAATLALCRVSYQQYEILGKTDATLRAAQRPWLTSVAEKSGINGPLTYNENGGDLPFLFLVTNTGNSPGVEVSLLPVGVIERAGVDPYLLLQKLCAKDLPIPRLQRDTIFPKDEILFPANIVFKKDDIASATAGPIKNLFPFIIGCISYEATFDRETPHRTSFIYELRRTGPRAPGGPARAEIAIFPDDGTIPKENLSLVRKPLGGFDAN